MADARFMCMTSVGQIATAVKRNRCVRIDVCIHTPARSPCFGRRLVMQSSAKSRDSDRTVCDVRTTKMTSGKMRARDRELIVRAGSGHIASPATRADEDTREQTSDRWNPSILSSMLNFLSLFSLAARPVSLHLPLSISSLSLLAAFVQRRCVQMGKSAHEIDTVPAVIQFAALFRGERA